VASVQKPDDFDYAIANFLDRFKRDPRPGLLVDEPPLLVGRLNDEGLADAYVAAVAAHLCQQQGLPFPKWVGSSMRIKKRPWFAAKTPNLKAILLQESPAAFRVRNLFVSANALSRA
jgi:hypothetical protein